MHLIKLLPDEPGIDVAEAELEAITNANREGRAAPQYIKVALEELAGTERRLQQMAAEIVNHFEQRREAIEAKNWWYA